MALSIKDNLRMVNTRIEHASVRRSTDLRNVCILPRLVVVSKNQPTETIIEAYQAGQHNFGEHYAQELIDKATDKQITKMCPSIQWHFIGRLHQNKIVNLLELWPQLRVIESIDSEACAKAVNDTFAKLYPEMEHYLEVLIQVNTSEEVGKYGVAPEGCLKLAQYIIACCDRLKFVGLTTAGSLEASTAGDQNKEFQKLVELRKRICDYFALNLWSCELSMGCSLDYEYAIGMGSTNVRIGSSVFGTPGYSQY